MLKQFEPPATALSSQLWDKEALWRRPNWRLAVADAVHADLNVLLAWAQKQHDPIASYDCEQVDLPAFDALALAAREELEHGSGVVWVQGLPVEARGAAACTLAYLAFGMRLGPTIDAYGRLYEVKDRGVSHKGTAIPVSQTRAETSFHTDSTARDRIPEHVGLLCLQPAIRGGDSLVTSAVRAHEQLRAERPDALRALYREFVRDIVTPGTPRSLDALRENRFPVFAHDAAGRGLTFRYMRYWIETGHANAGNPLDAWDVAALDALDAVLADDANVVQFPLAPGDMLWVNNRKIAHNRTEYDDDPERPRCLMRMWIGARSEATTR